MWIIKHIFIFMLISRISCEEDEVAKVKQVDQNSTINYIKYTNNGNFITPTVNVAAQPKPQIIRNATSYQAVPAYQQQSGNQCGGIFRNLQNLIESPKFISPRPICNLRCEYQIVSPYICENEFNVQFLDFEIDSSRDCENDRVIVNYDEILCGKIIGSKKFRTSGGVLNVTFSSRLWDLKDGKGFRLLITRLPCVEESKEEQTELDSLEPSGPEGDVNEHRCYHVNSSYSVSNPSIGQGHPIYGVPPVYNRTFIRGRQDIPVIPLPTPPPYYPTDPSIYPPVQPPIYPPTQPPIYPPYPGPPIGPIQPPIYPPILPPQFLPQCCRNNFVQQRFVMFSQGFPAYLVRNNDCIYVIHRSSPNVCRLRIVFKYFLLDDPQPGQIGCINNFIEIDGQRICGCKTNFVYETIWGYEPKVVRLRTLPGSFTNAQGFIFDVIQEPCPFKTREQGLLKVTDQGPFKIKDQGALKIQPQGLRARAKRHIKSEKFLLHPFLNKQQRPFPIEPQQPGFNFGNGFDFLPAIKQIKSDLDESFKSKFFQTQTETNFISNVCVMNHFRLFQIKLETLGMAKHYCLPF